MFLKKIFFISLFLSFFWNNGIVYAQKKCFVVTSYHQGYEWQDNLVQAVRSTLDQKCVIKQFNMDSKRYPDPAYIKKQALLAKKIIEEWKPDVLIVTDDNASKYLVKPYFKNKTIPIVFCGVNWTVKEYGYPYSNATGMVEIDPIRPLIKQIKRILPFVRHGACLSNDRLSARKACTRFQLFFRKFGIDIQNIFVKKMSNFEAKYKQSQTKEFVIFYNYAGIQNWNSEKAKNITLRHTKKLTTSTLDFMSKYVVLTVSKLAEEQGEFAGKVAVKILEGYQPNDFQIIANHRWNLYLNEELLQKVAIHFPLDLYKKSEKVK
ncbi:MAG: ABC-type uncharacterized transport system substrate-binding protein [bacterium]|jgi:ABC-type uncharacterized transport system substrate-binding protein